MHSMIRNSIVFCLASILWIGLVGCGEEAQPTPTPTQTTLPATTVPTPLPATPTSTALAPAPASPLAAVAPTSPLTSTAITTSAVLSPTAAAVGVICAIMPDLDLAGYPNLEQMGCAEANAQFDYVGINEFGPGPDYNRFMLWFSNELQIYVLLPDGTWQVYPDTWTEDQATFPCGNPLGEDEPESPPLPRRGFGKLWCENQVLQETMGTVEVEERLCQHAAVQHFASGVLLACYEDATIRYIRLLNDGTWDTVLTR